jgi:hypothetical protein
MAGYLEIQIDQGASFNTTVTIVEANNQPRDLTSSNAFSQIRKSYQSITSQDLTCVIFDAPNGVISLSMSASETANLKSGRYVYDVKTVDPVGYTQRVLEGIVVVAPGVTR